MHCFDPFSHLANSQVIARISETCGKRGILLKPFFDDAAQVRVSQNTVQTVVRSTLMQFHAAACAGAWLTHIHKCAYVHTQRTQTYTYTHISYACRMTTVPSCTGT